jgi:hypothetical protein
MYITRKNTYCLPGDNIVQFECSAHLPAQSNSASLDRKTVEGASVTFSFAPDNEYFMTYIFLKRIQAGVVNFGDKSDWNIDLSQVRNV